LGTSNLPTKDTNIKNIYINWRRQISNWFTKGNLNSKNRWVDFSWSLMSWEQILKLKCVCYIIFILFTN